MNHMMTLALIACFSVSAFAGKEGEEIEISQELSRSNVYPAVQPFALGTGPVARDLARLYEQMRVEGAFSRPNAPVSSTGQHSNAVYFMNPPQQGENSK